MKWVENWPVKNQNGWSDQPFPSLALHMLSACEQFRISSLKRQLGRPLIE